jgi:hypothetical protein
VQSRTHIIRHGTLISGGAHGKAVRCRDKASGGGESNGLAAFCGLPGIEAEPIDADLTTVTSEADRILHVQTPEYLAHIELQSTYAEDMDARILRYNVLAYCKYRLPVVSALFLLREEADGPAMSGRLDYDASGYAEASLQFRFKVLRVWETNPAEILNGSLRSNGDE